MTKPGDFERNTRTRVGGSRQGRLMGIVVALAALLLVAMVLTASLDAPPPPAAPAVATRPTASPPPAATASPAPRTSDLVYSFGVNYGFRNNAQDAPFLLVTDTNGTERYSVDGMTSGVLSSAGTRLYATTAAEIVALDAASGDELWRVDPTPLREHISASHLALTADQRTLAVYQQEVDPLTQAPAVRLSLIDTAAGDVTKTTIVPVEFWPVGFWSSALLFAPDNLTLYLVTGAKIRLLNTATEEVTLLHESARGQLAAALSPDFSTLYVTDGLEEISVYDAHKQIEVRRMALAEARLTAPIFNLHLQVSPDGERLALLASQQAAPSIQEGRRTVRIEGLALLTLDARTGTLIDRVDTLGDGWGSGLSYGRNGRHVYFLENDRFRVWHPSEPQLEPARRLVEVGRITSMLIGPYIEPAPRRTPRLIPTLVPPPTPLPTAEPLVTSDATAFVWLWHRDGSRDGIKEYRRDGTSSTVADYVLATVERPGQPPLLLVSLAEDQWGIFDPTSGISTPLQLAVHPGRRADAIPLINNLVLSPDGGQLALVTSRDPLPDDELTGLQQLVLIDLDSGAVQALADVGTWDRARTGMIHAWTADGIVVMPTDQSPSGPIPRGIWRINPADSAPAPELLIEFDPGGANVELDTISQMLLYEPYPADLAQAELRLRDLRTGQERVIYSGPFIDRDDLLIAPGGRHIAYIRLVDAFNSEVVLYDVAAGTARPIATMPNAIPGWYSWISTLRWSPDGETLFVSRYTQGAAGRDTEQGFRASDGTETTQIAWPERAAYTRFSADGQRLVSIYWQAQASLRLHQLQPATELLVNLPLDHSQHPTLSSSSFVNERQMIVYVP